MKKDMESYLALDHFDLVTPDGFITEIIKGGESLTTAIVHIENISPAFVGYKIDRSFIFFNIKSTLAQLGINGITKDFSLDPETKSAKIHVELQPIGNLGKKLLPLIGIGLFIGKLFAADPRRRVRDPGYLLRMFGRTDRDGLPLLSLGGTQTGKALRLEKIDGRTVAFLSLQEGVVEYNSAIEGLIPTLAKAFKDPKIKTRELLTLDQVWNDKKKRQVTQDEVLLVRTLPLHIRTVFGHVVNEFLPDGYHHTTASILQPDTKASGDVYELYGNSHVELTQIPLEFYTLEPHREHVFFSDRDQLQSSLEESTSIFKTFETAPKKGDVRSAIFIVKGEQLLNLSKEDWIQREVKSEEFPGLFEPALQTQMVQRYIEEQPEYPFLKAIEKGLITSQGALFTTYLPTPLMKKLLLEDLIQISLKRLYFQKPSQTHGDFFSHEDRSMLLDLAKFAIPVFWADKTTGTVLQFVPKPGKDTGMFVPIPMVEEFTNATVFGVYGSNLIEVQLEKELTKLLEGVLSLRKSVNHPLLRKDTPLALVTGGGPGVMEIGNRVAKNVNILSCANLVDFSHQEGHTKEQDQNPYIDAKMTYRIDRLVERQGEFNLDFPIFLMGGIGTDFELALEQVRRKVNIDNPTPTLLFGTPEYWREKITHKFQTNLKNGTIAGSEWVSNCFYCVQSASQGLKVYKKFFSKTLQIGKKAPINKDGFITIH